LAAAFVEVEDVAPAAGITEGLAGDGPQRLTGRDSVRVGRRSAVSRQRPNVLGCRPVPADRYRRQNRNGLFPGPEQLAGGFIAEVEVAARRKRPNGCLAGWWCAASPTSTPNRPGRPVYVYLAIMSLDPTGEGGRRWSIRWKLALNAFDMTFDRRLSAARR
jgi:hypothetical protein